MNKIADNVKTGENFSIGSFCIIEDDCVIGDNVKIGNYSIIQKGTVIGNDSVVGNYCEIGPMNSIGNNVVVQGRIRTAEGCTMEDDVTIKYGSILTSKVLLKKGCFLGPNVITLGSTHQRVTVHGTIIGEKCYIGAGSKIAGGVNVSDGVTVGALGFVNKNIDHEGVYVGVPVKKIR